MKPNTAPISSPWAVTSRPPAKRLHLAPSMLVDSIESGPSGDGATDTLIARRAVRLRFPNAIQRQRYIQKHIGLIKPTYSEGS